MMARGAFSTSWMSAALVSGKALRERWSSTQRVAAASASPGRLNAAKVSAKASRHVGGVGHVGAGLAEVLLAGAPGGAQFGVGDVQRLLLADGGERGEPLGLLVRGEGAEEVEGNELGAWHG
jgi:hypothetical protein